MINKFKHNWVAASIKQKSILKASSRFHALENPQARPPARDGPGAAAGPGSGAAGAPGEPLPEAGDADAHAGDTAGVGVHLPGSPSPGLAPFPQARWESGGLPPTPSPGSGSRPAGIWDEAAGVLEGNDAS